MSKYQGHPEAKAKDWSKVPTQRLFDAINNPRSSAEWRRAAEAELVVRKRRKPMGL